VKEISEKTASIMKRLNSLQNPIPTETRSLRAAKAKTLVNVTTVTPPPVLTFSLHNLQFSPRKRVLQ
jgi:hypothetical protein